MQITAAFVQLEGKVLQCKSFLQDQKICIYFSSNS